MVLIFRKLHKLPASIGGLKMLKLLKLKGTQMKDLLADIRLLSSVTTLELPNRLQSVPKSFQGLQAFSSLRLWRGAVDLGELGDFGAFTALNMLDLTLHEAVTILPKSLENLKWSVELDMADCRELLIVEALPEGFESLNLRGCCKLIKIPSLAEMRALVELDVRGCSSLRHVDGLDSLECITRCRLEGNMVCMAYNKRWLEVICALSYCGTLAE